MAWIEVTKRIKPNLLTTADLLIMLQPLLGGLVYLSILAGYPPLWLSWVIFIAPFLLRWWRWGTVVKRTPFDFAILILLIALLIGVVVSPNKMVSLEALQTYLICILGYYAGVTNGMRISWYWKLITLITFISFITLAMLTFAGNASEVRIVSLNQWLYQLSKLLPFSVDYPFNINALGTVMGLCVPGFLAFSLLTKQQAKRVIAGALAAFSAFLLIMSASANGLVAAFTGVCLLLIIWKPWILSLYLPGGIYALWLAISHYYSASALVWFLVPGSLISRFNVWRNTLLMLKDKVLTGIGLGTWIEQYYSLGGATRSPHNDFLQLYSDCGFLGGLAMLGAATIFIVLTWRMWQRQKKNVWWALGISSAVAIVAFATNGIFETFISGPLMVSVTSSLVTSYHYVAAPVIWVLAGIFSVAYMRLSSESHQE